MTGPSSTGAADRGEAEAGMGLREPSARPWEWSATGAVHRSSISA